MNSPSRHRSPHPWNLTSGSAALANDRGSLLPQRIPARSSPGGALQTADRMLLDEHRSAHGRCVRCECVWPCMVTIAARSRRSA
ncbi:hypothetical protein ABH937_000156 [Kitasatospora sp. GAS1066B]